MEIALIAMCIACVGLAGCAGFYYAMYKIEAIEEPRELTYEEKKSNYLKQIHNVLMYDGTEQGQVKLDED